MQHEGDWMQVAAWLRRKSRFFGVSLGQEYDHQGGSNMQVTQRFVRFDLRFHERPNTMFELDFN